MSENKSTCLEATNPLPLPLSSATTTGWQLDLCRLQSEAWCAWGIHMLWKNRIIAPNRFQLRKTTFVHLTAIGNCFASRASLRLTISQWPGVSLYILWLDIRCPSTNMWLENLHNINKCFPKVHLLTVANPALAKPALFLRHPKKTHSWQFWFVFCHIDNTRTWGQSARVLQLPTKGGELLFFLLSCSDSFPLLLLLSASQKGKPIHRLSHIETYCHILSVLRKAFLVSGYMAVLETVFDQVNC